MITKTFHIYTVNAIGTHGHIHIPNNTFRSEDDNEAKELAIKRAKEVAHIDTSFKTERKSKIWNVCIDHIQTIITTSKYDLKSGDF